MNDIGKPHLVEGTVSASGPHSIMELETVSARISPNHLPVEEETSLSENNKHGNARKISESAGSENGNAALSEVSDSESKRRPPPLEMNADQVIQSGNGPKTPLSPRSKYATSRADRERKIGHRRVGEGGEVTYKKIQSSQIMGSIQLGIGHAVGGLASKPERDLLMQDFMTVETTYFPSDGSQITPAHHYSDFKFKTYAPIAFRYFRDLFGIQPDDFLLSLCNDPLRELSNPGASGSIFYLSADDEFIIKTVQHKEGEFLQKLLPGYYMNLNQNPRTLLPKFFGLYCYQCNSKNVRLAVMNNILPSNIKLHEKYDLKGSTYKRKASKMERSKALPTYKDLDFMEIHPEGILLEAETYTALIKTIQRDCRVLESFKIMDYSLLVGVHNLDLAARELAESRHLNAAAPPTEDETSGDEAAAAGPSTAPDGPPPLVRSRSVNRQKLVAHSTALESIQAESDPIDEEEDVPPGGIPARNSKGERLLLFLGIIDILQSYRLKKKLEHTFKAMIHDGDTVSVHRPGFYSQRFQEFMAKRVFKKVPSPLKHSPSKKKLPIRTRATSVADSVATNQQAASEMTTSQDSALKGAGTGSSSQAGAVTPPSPGGGASASAGPSVSAEPHFFLGSSSGVQGTPLNLPAVLKDRVPSLHVKAGHGSRGPPPPVPPRSPKRVTVAASSAVKNPQAKVASRAAPLDRSDAYSVQSSSSTPPPAFSEVSRSHPDQHSVGSPVWNSHVETLRSGFEKRVETRYHYVEKRTHTLSISGVRLERRTESKSSSLSCESGVRTGGAPSSAPTPTWTEGTPSFTDSSSSGDLAYPGAVNSPEVSKRSLTKDSASCSDAEMTHF